MKIFSCRALFLLCLALPLAAHAQRIERSFPVTGDTVVELRNLNGRVTIQSWNQPAVRVVALRHSPAVEVHLEKAANRLHIHTHLLQSSAPAGERVVDYQLWAPADTQLEVQVEAGTVHVENFSADVMVKAVAATVLLRNLSGHTAVRTLNGSIESERWSGRLETTSISGSLRFRDGRGRFLVANTTSGDIFYEGALLPGGSYDFQNHEGLIELHIPAEASFELNATSVQGEVINEFPLTPRRHGSLPRPSSSHSLLGTVHSGEARVRATSFSGTIRVRKQ